MSNRIERNDCRALALETGLPESEVRRAVLSFFGVIVSDARKLPFKNDRRIFKKERFDLTGMVYNLPSIGRLGPVYSRYLKWRENESKNIEQVDRELYRHRITQNEIEAMAGDILAGKTPVFPDKRRNNKMYNRIWLVGKDGKRQARQVIPKREE